MIELPITGTVLLLLLIELPITGRGLYHLSTYYCLQPSLLHNVAAQLQGGVRITFLGIMTVPLFFIYPSLMGLQENADFPG